MMFTRIRNVYTPYRPTPSSLPHFKTRNRGGGRVTNVDLQPESPRSVILSTIALALGCIGAMLLAGGLG